MNEKPGLVEAAQLFKALGHTSRLWLLRELEREPRTVGRLCELTGLTQPLVSQHLRTLRHADLVTSSRQGKEVTYRLTDNHVAQIVTAALDHIQDPVTHHKKAGHHD